MCVRSGLSPQGKKNSVLRICELYSITKYRENGNNYIMRSFTQYTQILLTEHAFYLLHTACFTTGTYNVSVFCIPVMQLFPKCNSVKFVYRINANTLMHVHPVGYETKLQVWNVLWPIQKIRVSEEPYFLLCCTFRCVAPEDKSFAQGLSLVIVSLLAFIPGPIIYGAIIGKDDLPTQNV
jgi:hypothetical protein